METINFTVKGQNYVTEPMTVGRVVDLWKMRSSLSMGTYGQMYRFALYGSDAALNIIDVEAFFTVFCPDFIQKLKPSTISSMGISDYLEVEEVYMDQIKPWLVKTETMLKNSKDEV